MAKVIKRAELDKKFTEAVMKYMNKGLFVATSSMSEYQGEEGKIDLTDGNSTYRVLMYKTHKQFQGVIIVEVRKYDEYVTRGMHILWNDEGELVETVFTAYEIETRGSRENVYVETEEEAKRISDLQMDRYRGYGGYWRELPKFDVTKVRDAVRAQNKRGYKRVKRADIVRVERRHDKAQYRIEIAGKPSIVIG